MPNDATITDSVKTGGTGFAPDEPSPGTGPWVPLDTEQVHSSDGDWVKRLRRVTHSGRFVPEVDGLRFIAISSVVLFHLCGLVMTASSGGSASVGTASAGAASVGDANVLTNWLSSGSFGVQLFFVISGFILALPFGAAYLKAGKPVALAGYYLRRVKRLEPPYLVSLLICFGLLLLTQKDSPAELTRHLLASIFYLHNLIYGDGSTINYVAWSLEVEVQFYLLMPVFALLFRLRPHLLRRAIFCVLTLLLIACQNLVWSPNARITMSLLGQGQFFLMGFLLADFYLLEWNEVRNEAKQNAKTWLWDVICFVGWPLLFFCLQWSFFSVWLFPFAVFFLYVGTFRGHWFRRLISQPVLTVIGGMCYSIYLFHFQVIVALWRVTGKWRIGEGFTANFVLQCALMLPVILAVSTMFYLLVERPCMSRDWVTQLSAKLPFAKAAKANSRGLSETD